MAVIREQANTFPEQSQCFLCGEPIDIPYIFWQGGNGEAIVLHSECAEYLGINLLSDYLAYTVPRLGKVVRNG